MARHAQKPNLLSAKILVITLATTTTPRANEWKGFSCALIPSSGQSQRTASQHRSRLLRLAERWLSKKPTASLTQISKAEGLGGAHEPTLRNASSSRNNKGLGGRCQDTEL